MVLARNILAFLLGLVIGSTVNMGLIMLGHRVIPPPPGADVSTMESLAQSMPLFGPEQFVFPFLAHALGTLVGAMIGFVIASSHQRIVAMAIGGAFLAGGVANVFMLPAPAWFNTVDLLFAYLPMAWLAILMGQKFSSKRGDHRL